MDERPYKYEFSPLAEHDLYEIFDYIALEMYSPKAADHLIDNVQSAVEKVCEFPFSRPLLTNKALQRKGYRLLVVENFNIFYLVKGKTVIIQRVLYNKRNFENIL